MAENSLTELSNELAHAVETAAQYTVLVNARRRLPATGILYSTDLVLTADHVIEREEDLSVFLSDQQEVSATIVGRDPARDIALLRLAQPASVTAPVTRAPVRVGQLSIALGRPDPNGVQASLGMVGAVGGPVRIGRSTVLEQYIQTDAYPFPGFSGGPLISTDAEIIGLNTSGLSAGTLLTIPARVAWDAAASLASHGRIRRGYLGIRSQTVSLGQAQKEVLARTQSTGLLLISIEENSPASAAGLMTGDILVGVSGQPVSEHEQLQPFLNSESIGKTISFEILRGSTRTEVPVTVSEHQ
jgi:S1-C subfamily serine protease